jgi:hypothetical protein
LHGLFVTCVVTDKIVLHLNYPAFQDEPFALAAPELKKSVTTLRKIKRLIGTKRSGITG